MQTIFSNQKIRGWLSLAAAIVVGPIFVFFGYWGNLVFGLAAAAYFLVCATIVPLLVFAAGRLKFVVWQLAVVSLATSVVIDNVRLNALHEPREILSTAYAFWVFGTLLSSPLPIFFRLRPLPPRRRYIEVSIFAAVGLALYLVIGLVVR